VAIRADEHSKKLPHYVCPVDYKTVYDDTKKNFTTVMQIRENIKIPCLGGEEVVNNVRAFD
jgi:hypothetical protein